MNSVTMKFFLLLIYKVMYPNKIRMSNDGTKALLHEETYNMLVPPIMMLSEGEEDIVYPYPLMDENEIMNSNEWTKDEEL